MRLTTIALTALCLAACPVSAQEKSPKNLLLVGLDGKTFFEPEGSRNGPEGHDAVAVVDIGDPARPKLAHVIPLPNSVYGPPTNLQITPDGRLGLVASSVTMRAEGPDAPYYAQPDDRLHVIDLAAEPPKLVETIRVGRQPSGLAIARSGAFALVANREGRSVTLLTIRGSEVRVAATVDVGGEAAAVAIVPDGSRAFVAKNKAGTVGVIAIRGTELGYDASLDMPVGPGTYGLEVTPDGRYALSGNTGATPSDGHADTVGLIAATGPRSVVLDQAGIGDTAETLAIAPDGRHAVVSVVKGASAPQTSPAYTAEGAAVLVAIGEGTVRKVSEAPAGNVTQGVVFDPSGAYAYLGNYVDRTLAVYAIEGDTIRATGFTLALPGQPASLRGRP